MTYERIDEEQFYKRVNEKLEEFVPLNSGEGSGSGSGSGAQITNNITEIVTSGVVPTLVVVASNAPDWIIAAAEVAEAGWLICDGESDHEELDTAVNSLPSDRGTVIMSAGTFTLSSGLVVPSSVMLIGRGELSTTLTGSFAGPMVTVRPGATIRDFGVDNAGGDGVLWSSS